MLAAPLTDAEFRRLGIGVGVRVTRTDAGAA
jgi:hypothetical protein